MAAIGYQNITFTHLTYASDTTTFGVINPCMGLFMSFKVNKKVKGHAKMFLIHINPYTSNEQSSTCTFVHILTLLGYI